MNRPAAFDAWSVGHNYEQYMGRWSRLLGRRFLEWLRPARDATWLEIGCGTGALTSAILEHTAPSSLLATDPSDQFIAFAGKALPDPRVTFVATAADALPADDASHDYVTSSLVLNFIPDRMTALTEMRRVLRPGGVLSFCVWDYPSGGVGFIDAFWKAAAQVDERAVELDEAKRFAFCTRDGLLALCRDAGLAGVEVEPVEINAEFADFDAMWHPFTLGAGPAPGFLASLPEERRLALKTAMAKPFADAQPIRLVARAWAGRAGR